MTKALFYAAAILFSLHLNAQQEQIKSNWATLLKLPDLDEGKVFKVCPNFPRLEKYNTDSEFEKAIQNWAVSFPQEKEKLFSLPSVVEKNPSPYYLGITNGEEPFNKIFQNSFWQWVEASGISDKRMQEVAPHFPKPEITGNKINDESKYNLELEKWRTLYAHEYNQLINAEELVKLNPYYTGYVKAIQLPYYVKGLRSYEKPLKLNTGNNWEDEINYQLDLQSWYFLFHPNDFKSVFGFDIILPDNFDAEAFRNRVIKKIENQKKYENGEIPESELPKENITQQGK